MSSTPLFQLNDLLGLLQRQGQQYTASHRGLLLNSYFQPIFSFAHRRVVGHEGLMRAWTTAGQSLPPTTVFTSTYNEPELVTLDRLSRLLHVQNFCALSSQLSEPSQWLFLNAEPNAFTQMNQYGHFFPELLSQLGIPPERIVIEVLETAIENHRALARSVAYFREMGCLIAIDDFGAGHSNVDRVWRLRPEIVKLDRSLIANATCNRDARRILPGLVSLLHEAGALVLAEGVETETEAFLALEADCDLVQGYYFARPAPGLLQSGPTEPLFQALWRNFNARMRLEIENNQQQLAPYCSALLKGAARLAEAEPFAVSAQAFLVEPASVRYFLLDAEGRQVNVNTRAGDHPTVTPRFSPLDDTHGAIWSRRHYFRQAMRRFGELQISRPYLSIVGEEQCITLSLGLLLDGNPHVLCGDIQWSTASGFDSVTDTVLE
ncbi:sensor domain-containing phosphodiesterase [Chitinimonas sp. BJB300]|uniref:sensor domain-containing phosphodiesterase n=1 Tax=Chitinimonas sp. BJB300 TaxID=1559339 RepID=UPI000C0F2A7D|nr:EAL domain-containing protein [Chitinimonas sp. BJB300]PHV12918.1 diguanylate phosphodiesterase [Chitinimonas sp. BJB300]TSJ88487.1 EAL domain-containing protein [Chitinimonas sp. BJB300]